MSTDLITTAQDSFRSQCIDAFVGLQSFAKGLAERAPSSRVVRCLLVCRCRLHVPFGLLVVIGRQGPVRVTVGCGGHQRIPDAAM